MDGREIKSRRRKSPEVNMTPMKLMLIGILVLVGIVFIYMGTDYLSNPSYEEMDTSYLSERYIKELVVAQNSIDKQIAEQNTTTATDKAPAGTVPVNGDKFGTYLREWYAFMSVYESTSPLGINMDDGGFGIYQATHSELGDLVDGLYALDSTYYADLKQYVDNPLSYLKSCKGGDTGHHTWGKCRTYPAGSQILAATCQQYVDSPQKVLKWYNDCLTVHEKTMKHALEKALEYTGKTADTIGPGTMATAYAATVRYSDDTITFKNCHAGMTEDEFIEQVNQNCYNKGHGKRFICQNGLAKKLNAGQLDIYGVITCGGECGGSHGNNASSCWGHQFGMEGY